MAAAPSELEFPAVSSPPVSEAKAARLAAEKEWRENPENALDDDEPVTRTKRPRARPKASAAAAATSDAGGASDAEMGATAAAAALATAAAAVTDDEDAAPPPSPGGSESAWDAEGGAPESSSSSEQASDDDASEESGVARRKKKKAVAARAKKAGTVPMTSRRPAGAAGAPKRTPQNAARPTPRGRFAPAWNSPAEPEEHTAEEFFLSNLEVLGVANPDDAALTVVRELVENAIDACVGKTDDAHVRVSVKEVESAIPEKPFLRITVGDTGCGMPEDKVPTLMGEMFASTKTPKKGTGGAPEAATSGKYGIGSKIALMYAAASAGGQVQVCTATADAPHTSTFTILCDPKTRKKIVARKEPNGIKPAASMSFTRVTVVIPATADAMRTIGLYLRRLAVVPSHVNLEFTLGSGSPEKRPACTPLTSLEDRARQMMNALAIAMPVLDGRVVQAVGSGSAEDSACGVVACLLMVNKRPESEVRDDRDDGEEWEDASELSEGDEALVPAPQEVARPPLCHLSHEIESGSPELVLLRFANGSPMISTNSACAISKALHRVKWADIGAKVHARPLASARDTQYGLPMRGALPSTTLRGYDALVLAVDVRASFKDRALKFCDLRKFSIVDTAPVMEVINTAISRALAGARQSLPASFMSCKELLGNSMREVFIPSLAASLVRIVRFWPDDARLTRNPTIDPQVLAAFSSDAPATELLATAWASTAEAEAKDVPHDEGGAPLAAAGDGGGHTPPGEGPVAIEDDAFEPALRAVGEADYEDEQMPMNAGDGADAAMEWQQAGAGAEADILI